MATGSISSGQTGIESETVKLFDSHKMTEAELMHDPTVLKLYRIFLLFAPNENADGVPLSASEQKIHKSDVERMYRTIYAMIDQENPTRSGDECPCKLYSTKFEKLCEGETEITFRKLLDILPHLIPLPSPLFECAISRIYDKFINQVLIKGILLKVKKSGIDILNITKARIKKYWCVVLPGRLLYSTEITQQKRRSLILSKSSKIIESKNQESNDREFRLVAGKHSVTFRAEDPIEKERWVEALKLSINLGIDSKNIYRSRCLRRFKERNQVTSSQSPQSIIQSSSKTEEELDMARQNFKKLSFENERLRAELTAERQATRDEEIVRNIATRMLEDERRRREKLEELLQLQQISQEDLNSYKKKVRVSFEEKAKSRETELNNLENGLIQLQQNAVKRNLANHENITLSPDETRMRKIETLKTQQEDLFKMVSQKQNIYTNHQTNLKTIIVTK